MQGPTQKGVEVWWPYARIYSLQYEFRLFLGISVTFVDSLFLMASNNYRHQWAPGEVTFEKMFLDVYNNLKESCLSSQTPNNVISNDTEIIIQITSQAIYKKVNVFNYSITEQKSERELSEAYVSKHFPLSEDFIVISLLKLTQFRLKQDKLTEKVTESFLLFCSK